MTLNILTNLSINIINKNVPDVSQIENATENSPILLFVEYFSKPVGVYVCKKKRKKLKYQ